MWAIAAAGFFAKIFWNAPPRRSGHLGLPPARLAAGGRRPPVGRRHSDRGALVGLHRRAVLHARRRLLKFDTKVPYFHALWHLAVVAGTTWHYFAILIFVVPAA